MFHCRFQVFFLFVCLSVLSNKHLKPAKNRREEPTGNKTFVLTFACFTFFHAQKEARTSTLTTHNNKVASQVKPNMLKHQRLREFGCYTFKPWQAQYFRSKHCLPRKTFLRRTGPATLEAHKETFTWKPAVQCHKCRTKRSPSVSLVSCKSGILRLPAKQALNASHCGKTTIFGCNRVGVQYPTKRSALWPETHFQRFLVFGSNYFFNKPCSKICSQQ